MQNGNVLISKGCPASFRHCVFEGRLVLRTRLWKVGLSSEQDFGRWACPPYKSLEGGLVLRTRLWKVGLFAVQDFGRFSNEADVQR